MRRLAPGLALTLIVATLVLLGAVTSAWAHNEHTAAFSGDTSLRHADLAPAAHDGVETLVLSASADPPALPWPLLIGALLTVLLCGRRPRRAIALAVVLLLAVLCFEDGLHSVHHLTGQAKLARCAVAAATAHLTATAVDNVGTTDIVLPVVAVATESGPADPVARFLSPDQGRAPPPPIA